MCSFRRTDVTDVRVWFKGKGNLLEKKRSSQRMKIAGYESAVLQAGPVEILEDTFYDFDRQHG
jgi:hypothetical protein